MAPNARRETQSQRHSRDSDTFERKRGELPLKRELVELCSEIAGALLRGYSDGKSGLSVRRLIVAGLEEKIGCRSSQAESLVDLSLELIHFQAYGKVRSNSLELSLLVAKSGGEFADPFLN